MKVAQYFNCDTVNGPGIRVSLFVSGCTVGCKGCFSPKSHSFDYGKEFDLLQVLEDLRPSHIKGLSILGGHMFERPNIGPCFELLNALRYEFGSTRDVWVWTGLTYERLLAIPEYAKALPLIDVLVDGPFVEKLKDRTLPYRGSSNQRIIHL